MFALGSTETGAEIRALASLRHEYNLWRKGGGGANAEGLDAVLQKEAARLAGEGKGQKIIGLLELRLGALGLAGLGEAHPTVQEINEMIDIFTEHGATEKADK